MFICRKPYEAHGARTGACLNAVRGVERDAHILCYFAIRTAITSLLQATSYLNGRYRLNCYQWMVIYAVAFATAQSYIAPETIPVADPIPSRSLWRCQAPHKTDTTSDHHVFLHLLHTDSPSLPPAMTHRWYRHLPSLSSSPTEIHILHLKNPCARNHQCT